MHKHLRKIHVEDLEFFHTYTKTALKKLLRKAEEQKIIITQAEYMIKHTLDNYDSIVAKVKQDSRAMPIMAAGAYETVFAFLSHYIYRLFEESEKIDKTGIEIGSRDLFELYSQQEGAINITPNRFGRILTIFCDNNNLEFEKLVRPNNDGVAKRFYGIYKKLQNN